MTHSWNILICCAIALMVVAVESQLQCNGFNEEVRCVQKCPPERTCRNRHIKYSCINDPDPCVNKCVCKNGYYRNAIGDCITGKQCDQCSKPNEYYSCGGACDNECKSIKYQNQTNCPIVNVMCNKQCYCDEGYARDDSGNCIPISECGPSCSDPNEEYVLSKTCPPDSCESLVAKYKCDSKEVPQNRCRCKSGYLRLDGKCVEVCSCPQMRNSPDCFMFNDYLE
ncbi:hypothetical protein ACJJTC_000438 [Scirpophaga incertulas]